VRRGRLLVAAILLVLAAGALLLAGDVRSWEDSLARGDARLAEAPATARWQADMRLPADPAGRLLALADDLALRRSIRAFRVAERTPRAFDGGLQRTRARSAAEAALADVAAGGPAQSASLAQNLFGVLVYRTGRVADGTTGEERSVAAFETAVRLDPGNADAKYNLELLLQRARPTGTHECPGTGSGPRGTGRRGAGAGTPGRGY
jgi:hypothetical protein